MRTTSKVEELKAFLAGVPPRQRRIVATLRRLIPRAAPQTEETVLWGSLSYHRPAFGGRIKGAVCLITPRPDCVHLGFIHGAAIADPDHLLRGAGKAKRFVPIRDVREIEARALSRLIKAADEFDPRKPA
jgi:hypothetical protein